MKRESLIFLISGTFFGVLVGWIIGSQQGRPVTSVAAPPAAAEAPASTDTPQPPPLDVQRATALEKQAQSQPSNVAVRLELANMYYDAQRFDIAATWYEQLLKLDPHNVDASTDLAVCYHYQGQHDRALAQIDKSLEIDPKHTKTLLNQGIIRAWGKNDLEGAAKSWQRLIEVAPNSEDAKRAQQGLDGINASHPGLATGKGKGGTE
jgi:cytochrome c-type biogenesis protein CcmH/NrfG